MGKKYSRLGFAGIGIVAIAMLSLGIPFDTTFRVGCAAVCLLFIAETASDYPGERWPWIALSVALLINICLFFTPLINRPAARGELIVFGLPDAIIFLAARLVTYQVVDVHQRAVRQQIILGLAVLVLFCALIFAAILLGHPTSGVGHRQ